MIKTQSNWREFLLRTSVLGVVIFGAVRLAVARDGVPGGPARSFVTVAGTLTGVDSSTAPTMTFTFSAPAQGTRPMVTCPGVAGQVRWNQPNFSAEIPIEGCVEGLLDGRDVEVSAVVSTGGTSVAVPATRVNPVPYARYADQYGTPECPVGYSRDQTAVPAGAIVCTRVLTEGTQGNVDYVVRVGRGPSAFWIDQYESSVWSNSNGAAPRRFDAEGNAGIGSNGQWATGMNPGALPPVYALSRAGAPPARWITWFQAQEACRASGKRLPTGEEWLAAAQGTRDPGMNDGSANANCNTFGSVRLSPDRGNLCISVWGAQDMIGNVWEWTADWQSPANEPSAVGVYGGSGWPSGYDSDQSENVPGSALVAAPLVYRSGLPTAIARGGSASSGPAAGVFAYSALSAPVNSGPTIGFRCVIPR